MNVPPADRLAGCFIGLCLGDALGAPVEGAPPEEARRYVSGWLRAGRAGEQGRDGLPFGQYTDDSQLARELLLTIAERGVFDPADFAKRVADLVAQDRLVGGGRGTIGAAERLLRGHPWEEAGAPAPYAGNGCAMRVGPLGVLYANDPHRLIEITVRQSRVTHQEPRCAAGAVAIAGAVTLAIREGPIEPGRFLEQLAAWVDPVAPGFGAAVRQVRGWLDLPPAAISGAAVAGGLESPSVRRRWRTGISPFVTASVCAGLYAFLRSPDDYWETICTAIEVGGDTDTIAAMAGAIAGARQGLARLPGGLTAGLNDRGEWDYAALLELTDRCLAVTAAPPPEIAPS